MDVASGAEFVAFEIEDGVGDELAWAVESCLAAAEGFVEFCSTPWCCLGEIALLLGAECADFTPAAGVDGVELGGDYCWCLGWGGCGISFVGEELRDEVLLEFRGMCVGGDAGEVEMPEEHGITTTWLVARVFLMVEAEVLLELELTVT